MNKYQPLPLNTLFEDTHTPQRQTRKHFTTGVWLDAKAVREEDDKSSNLPHSFASVRVTGRTAPDMGHKE